jgi:hypothetical protein
MFDPGDIICVATDKFSVIGKIVQGGSKEVELTGLFEKERESVSQLSFFKIGDMFAIDEGMNVLISRDKIVTVSTGVKTNVSPQ